MNRKIYWILGIFILCITVSADDQQRIIPENNIFIFYQGYSIEAYNAIGFSNALTSTLSDLPSANPASLSNYEKPGIGLNMEYHTSIKNALGFTFEKIGHSRINQFIPQSFSAVYPTKILNLGVGFQQKYSGRIDFEPIQITTIQNPQGTGEFFEPEFKRIIYSGNLILSKKFENLFGAEHHLSAGAQMNLDYFSGKEEISNLKATYTDETFTWKLGIRYTYQDILAIAAIFDKGSSFSGNIELNQEIIQDTSGFFQPVQLERKFKLKTPDRLILGYQLQGIPWLWINGSANLVYWRQVYNTLKNHLDYSVNFIINGNKKFSYSFGYYRSDIKSREGNYIISIDYEAHFLSAGFRARFESMAIYLNIMDSHLSTTARRQTIGKLGIEYQF